MPAYTAQIPLLQNRLPLFRFFCAQLGAADGFKTLRGWLKDVQRLNTGRTPRVQLPYFQWLAVQFNEWFLARHLADAKALRAELNRWLNDNLHVA